MKGSPQEERIFPTAKSFREAAAGYFDACDERDEVYSIAGLCLWLSDHNRKGKVVTRERLYEWWTGDKNPALCDDVKYALLRIQQQREAGKIFLEPKMAGARNFDLKQAMLGGFTDKTEVKNDVKFELSIKDFSEDLAK